MSWRHLSDEHPVARKPHHCFLCGETIEVGEKHVRRTSVDGRELCSLRMHLECEKESQDWDETDWECFFEGDAPRPTRGNA